MTFHSISYIHLLGVLYVAMMLSACSSEEPQTQMPMEYYVTSDEESRAIPTVPLDGNVYSVYAKAIHTNNGISNAYFNNDPLKLDYSSGKYVATGYYFPLSGQVKMVAFGLNSLNPESTDLSWASINTVSDGSNFSTITVSLTKSDGTKEFIYSDISTVTCPITSTTIPSLHFHTPYALVKFNFIPADDKTCEQIIINEIQVPSVIWQGNFSISYNNDGSAQSPSWTNLANPSTKTITFSESQKMGWDDNTKSAIPLVHNLCLLKQVTTRPQIIISYTVKNGTTINGNVKDKDDNVRKLRYIIPADNKNSWNMNYQYNYNITVHGNCQMDLTNIDVKKMEHQPTGTMNI